MAGEFFQNMKRLQHLVDMDTLSMLGQFKKAGFRDLNVSTKEAILVLHAAERRLGRELSREEVLNDLGDLLVDDDYKVLDEAEQRGSGFHKEIAQVLAAPPVMFADEVAALPDDEDENEKDLAETEGLDKIKSETALQYLKYMKSVSLADLGEEPLFSDHQCRMLMLAASRKYRMASALHMRAAKLEQEGAIFQSLALCATDTQPFVAMMEGIYGSATDEAVEEFLQDPNELLAILGDEEDPDASVLVKFLRATGKKAQQVTGEPQPSTSQSSGSTSQQPSGEPAPKRVKLEPGTSAPASQEEIETATPIEQQPLCAPEVRDLVAATPIIPVDHNTLHVFGIPKDKMPIRDNSLYAGQYRCAVCSKLWSNRPEACTHTRTSHLGTCLQCPYCQYRNFGGRQWLTHMGKEHKGMDFYPTRPPMMSEEQAALIDQIAQTAREVLEKKGTPSKEGTGGKGRGKHSGSR